MSTSRWKIHLVPSALLAATVLGAVVLISVVIFNRVFLTVETAGQRIYDVAMPVVFDTAHQVRVIERLANGGRAIALIDSAAERRAWRIQLGSVASDASLQGEPATRELIARAFSELDRTLAELDRQGAAARPAQLRRWSEIELALSDRAEALTAEASTKAAGDVDAILEAVEHTRRWGAGALLVLGWFLATAISLFLWLVVQPIQRVTRSLAQAREGYLLRGRHEWIHEIQLLDEAAISLAEAHRELEVARGALESQAHSDALTGLANRRRFDQIAQIEFARAQRYGRALTVLAVDLDHFKRINDSYGHHAGDAVLHDVGECLLRACRGQDVVARLGGEEFAVLLPECGARDGYANAERLRRTIAELAIPLPDSAPIHVTASIGVSAVSVADLGFDEVHKRADRALYQAKEHGRNRIEVEPPLPPD